MRPSVFPRIILGIAATVLLRGVPASACDVCAIYTATEVAEGRTGFRAGVGQQYSYFATERLNGSEIPGFGEFMNSSITQFVLGYQFTNRFGLQLNIPFIARTFRRLEDDRLVDGDSIGAGDLSLIGNLLAYAHQSERSVFLVHLLGGLKLPSGNPDFLGEELAATPTATAPALRSGVPAHATGGEPQHGGGGGGGAGHESGVHGHDLALGSGSVDGVVGGSVYWSYDRFFVTAAMQYAIRREGAFDYRYANDLTWVGGPGFYPLLEHDYTLGLQAVFSGETKGKDTQAGQRLDDTGITALYAGPGVRFTWGTQLSVELTGDLPVIQNNTALQIVPNFRVRGGLVWRF